MSHALLHLADIADAETIATSSGIREIARLRKRYGRGRWRKRKGIAEVELPGQWRAMADEPIARRAGLRSIFYVIRGY